MFEIRLTSLMQVNIVVSVCWKKKTWNTLYIRLMFWFIVFKLESEQEQCRMLKFGILYLKVNLHDIRSHSFNSEFLQGNLNSYVIVHHFQIILEASRICATRLWGFLVALSILSKNWMNWRSSWETCGFQNLPILSWSCTITDKEH
jgi:hypothetical protein